MFHSNLESETVKFSITTHFYDSGRLEAKILRITSIWEKLLAGIKEANFVSNPGLLYYRYSQYETLLIIFFRFSIVKPLNVITAVDIAGFLSNIQATCGGLDSRL